MTFSPAGGGGFASSGRPKRWLCSVHAVDREGQERGRYEHGGPEGPMICLPHSQACLYGKHGLVVATRRIAERLADSGVI